MYEGGEMSRVTRGGGFWKIVGEIGWGGRGKKEGVVGYNLKLDNSSLYLGL